MQRWSEVCRRCGRIRRPPTGRWRCDCGGLLDLVGPRPLDRANALPATAESRSKVTLGGGHTPLVQQGPGLWLKLDYVMPTGSFKDRGAAEMVAFGLDLGVRTAVADSSGNAGISISAHCARAGIALRVFVPESTDPSKTVTIASCGATVEVVPGGREAAAAAAVRHVEETGAWYASHVFQPAFVHGVKTLAFELYDQLGGRPPATVVVPAGNGTLVVGLWLGFRKLGVPVPAIVAVQAEACAPLAGMAPRGTTAAAGIAVPSPPRAGEVRGAVLASGGSVVTVTEEEIGASQAELAAMGMLVEPTGAASWAGWRRAAAAGDPTVVVLTGRAHQ